MLVLQSLGLDRFQGRLHSDGAPMQRTWLSDVVNAMARCWQMPSSPTRNVFVFVALSVVTARSLCRAHPMVPMWTHRVNARLTRYGTGSFQCSLLSGQCCVVGS